MILREARLPAGWYPRDREQIEAFLRPYGSTRGSSSAAIAPHAGWHYSGTGAALALCSLDPRIDTLVLIGGHLRKGMPVLSAPEEGLKTPLGTMRIDKELQRAFEELLECQSDTYMDNTIPVLLPMAHYFFPEAAVLWLRFPADISSYTAGELIWEAARSIKRPIGLIASADLTHYGDSYGFTPQGRGQAALEWVRNHNDAALIEAILKGDAPEVLSRSEKDSSTCSVGAILGALGFIAAKGKTCPLGPKVLLDYRTSADADPGSDISSFVGYGTISLG
ncbi:MAG: AmmeMemoRadiSam system protein B [Treponema sp.]|nr:AmmeMemoRadiSam system protein B [Treponema sp.]